VLSNHGLWATFSAHTVSPPPPTRTDASIAPRTNTAPCQTADDCSPGGPEFCASSTPPSFDPNAPTTQLWCILGCTSGTQCRTRDGYSCIDISAADGYGLCNVPLGA